MVYEAHYRTATCNDWRNERKKNTRKKSVMKFLTNCKRGQRTITISWKKGVKETHHDLFSIGVRVEYNEMNSRQL
jgi:uncharacterized FAD-dependent dehydrogenase